MGVSNTPVRLGIIGCGNVTENRHLPAIESVHDLQVVALADIDHERLNRVADRFGVENRYVDYGALLADPDVTAVAVCAPMQWHGEMAIAALDAGKHVFVEKPLAPSLDEAETLVARAAESPCKVMVGYNLRWHRLVRQAREMIQQGKLGRIELAVATFTSGTRYKRDILEWKKRRALGGGVLMEFATHYFDLWRFLLDTEVEEVFATTRSDEWDDVSGTLTARLTDGVLATAYFSEWTSERNEVHIYGQAGSLHLSLYRFDGLEFVPLFTAPGQIRGRLSRGAQSLRHLPMATAHFRRGGDYYASFIGQWRHFAGSIREDVPMECTLHDGRRALQVALAAAQSASTGEPVRVEEAHREISAVPHRMSVGA
jgi:myo-inositol 2-dehydrogenase/D-chiro-inositol 1-dehydrogenase